MRRLWIYQIYQTAEAFGVGLWARMYRCSGMPSHCGFGVCANAAKPVIKPLLLLQPRTRNQEQKQLQNPLSANVKP